MNTIRKKSMTRIFIFSLFVLLNTASVGVYSWHGGGHGGGGGWHGGGGGGWHGGGWHGGWNRPLWYGVGAGTGALLLTAPYYYNYNYNNYYPNYNCPYVRVCTGGACWLQQSC
jgi:hypothetical protein